MGNYLRMFKRKNPDGSFTHRQMTFHQQVNGLVGVFVSNKLTGHIHKSDEGFFFKRVNAHEADDVGFLYPTLYDCKRALQGYDVVKSSEENFHNCD